MLVSQWSILSLSESCSSGGKRIRCFSASEAAKKEKKNNWSGDWKKHTCYKLIYFSDSVNMHVFSDFAVQQVEENIQKIVVVFIGPNNSLTNSDTRRRISRSAPVFRISTLPHHFSRVWARSGSSRRNGSWSSRAGPWTGSSGDGSVLFAVVTHTPGYN